MIMKEQKIGECFEIDGKWYMPVKCADYHDCDKCS